MINGNLLNMSFGDFNEAELFNGEFIILKYKEALLIEKKEII